MKTSIFVALIASYAAAQQELRNLQDDTTPEEARDEAEASLAEGDDFWAENGFDKPFEPELPDGEPLSVEDLLAQWGIEDYGDYGEEATAYGVEDGEYGEYGSYGEESNADGDQDDSIPPWDPDFDMDAFQANLEAMQAAMSKAEYENLYGDEDGWEDAWQAEWDFMQAGISKAEYERQYGDEDGWEDAWQAEWDASMAERENLAGEDESWEYGAEKPVEGDATHDSWDYDMAEDGETPAEEEEFDWDAWQAEWDASMAELENLAGEDESWSTDEEGSWENDMTEEGSGEEMEEFDWDAWSEELSQAFEDAFEMEGEGDWSEDDWSSEEWGDEKDSDDEWWMSDDDEKDWDDEMDWDDEKDWDSDNEDEWMNPEEEKWEEVAAAVGFLVEELLDNGAATIAATFAASATLLVTVI